LETKVLIAGKTLLLEKNNIMNKQHYDDDNNNLYFDHLMLRQPISGHLPWLSFIYSIICFYILASNLKLNIPLNQEIVSVIHHPSHLTWLLICALLIYLLDFISIKRKQKEHNDAFVRLNEQFIKSREEKVKQQLRANTYSDHTSKLKSFISDKLIEYMDFDEKFIHFKGIAAEVRHNGVISYDKINTALNQAIEQQRFLTIFEQEKQTEVQEGSSTTTINNSQTSSSLYDYQAAKEAISYLWDLLDLSTAENMSLYIGKKLIDYEENYFQIKLSMEQNNSAMQPTFTHPTFFALESLLMSMKLFVDSDEIKHHLINSNINNQLYQAPFQFKDEQFSIHSDVTDELLGNPNHIVLLLENLIKNSQFFSNKVRFKQNSDRIHIHLEQVESRNQSDTDNPSLDEFEQNILFSIYNRGQNIKDEDIDKIFKLGYSTRRKKEFNGRGLGLYFVHEIVKGYQGSIKATNIQCKDLNFKILLGLASGEEFIYQTESKLIEGRMNTSIVNQELQGLKSLVDFQHELKLEKDIPLRYFQIINNETSEVFTSNDLESEHQKEKIVWTDPISQLPLWEVCLTPYKKRQIFTFKALDITGVRFDVNIPSVIE